MVYTYSIFLRGFAGMKTNYAKTEECFPSKAAASFCACAFSDTSACDASCKWAERSSSAIRVEKDTSLVVSFSLVAIFALMIVIPIIISLHIFNPVIIVLPAIIVSLRLSLHIIIINHNRALPCLILPIWPAGIILNYSRRNESWVIQNKRSCPCRIACFFLLSNGKADCPATGRRFCLPFRPD